MRRVLSRLNPVAGSSWLAQLGAASGQSASRCAGEASTSYSALSSEGTWAVIARCLSGKAAAKGKVAPPAPPPPPPAAAREDCSMDVLASAGMRLRRRKPGPDPLSLLTPEQRQLAERFKPPPPQAKGGTEAAPLPPPPPPAPLRGLGQLGLPLDRGDVASLLQQSLSNAVEQNVHFQPIVFSNVFQSAPAVAAYVAAALESGTAWNRVERFFLASVEADSIVRGIKVQIAGRIGRKADIASKKVWQWGEMSRRNLADHVDYGASPALTRLGVLGVKVWIRYKRSAVTDVFFPRQGGSHHRSPAAEGAKPAVTLDELYRAAATRTTRIALPYRYGAVGWWERSAPEQPPANLVSEVFTPDYDPAAGDRLAGYLQRRREERRRFRTAAERLSYLETIGRFMAKQRRLRSALSTTQSAEAGSSDAEGLRNVAPLGRRANRALGRFRLSSVSRASRRMQSVILRHRLKQQKPASGASASAKGSKGGPRSAM